MANRSGRRLPSLRLHRTPGQAVVRLVNRDGQRRDYYLGKHGSRESQERTHVYRDEPRNYHPPTRGQWARDVGDLKRTGLMRNGDPLRDRRLESESRARPAG